jgi:heme exporter protein C
LNTGKTEIVGLTALASSSQPGRTRKAGGPAWLWQYASPQRFYPIAGRMVPVFLVTALLLTLAGLYVGFFVAPTDHQQGEAYRIIFVHVPVAWLSMLIYVVMAFWAGLGWVLNTRLSSMMARALAPTGASFTFLALWTGALWGKPTWGTWWVWDARLTSELILLFLYIGFMALQSATDDPRRGDKAGALLAMVGVVNVPVIYFSVQWWNTLHQGASISFKAAPTMASTMLIGMLLASLGLWAYAIAAALMRLRSIILEREGDADWVRRLPEVVAASAKDTA